jgi:WD40 repeat protein/DNA-binding winged helix-turn-helix (wHTH) protein
MRVVKEQHKEEMKGQAQVIYEFAGFRLDPGRRILMRRGQPVALAPKGLDTLLFLIQNSGRVVEKDELMKALWPDSFVEEGNLAQNIFVLRRTLGDEKGSTLITTIPRRGYKFVAPVKLLEVPAHAAQSSLSAAYWSGHSPFRGLQVFEPDDAWLFFGRDAETKELVIRLRRSPVVVVIGNSGCGKSSLVRAGLIPALRRGHFLHGDESGNSCIGPEKAPRSESDDSWRIAIIRPSAAPFNYLAEVLPNQLAPELDLGKQAEFIADGRSKLPLGGDTLRDAICALANAATQESDQTRILLVADQFEEIFALTASPQIRERYIDALLATSRWDGSVPVHLVLILRADFYSHCLEHSNLSDCLELNVYNVPRMTHEQLRESIEERLTLAGAHAESGLIDSLLEDVGAEPGNLALLEHALSQLWEKCGGFGCTLTNSTYSKIGRLRGAMNAHADEVYGTITDEGQRELAKKIFLELVHLGEDAPDTRRRARKEDLLLLGASGEIEPLLARLTASRLISMGGEGHETFAEVSHEALIREWSTLREWITQNREELRLARRLFQAADEWKSLSSDSGALLQGARLAQGEEWLAGHPAAPPLVREFLQTSRAARVAAEKRQLRNQRAAVTRLRWFSSVLVVALLVSLSAAWIAYREQLTQRSIALAAQASELLPRDQGQALDLAIRSEQVAKTDEARLMIARAFPGLLATLKHEGPVERAVFSPDGQHILTASYDGTARVWNAADGASISVLQGHSDKVEHAVFSPDGQFIATASDDKTARVWTADGRLLTILKAHTAAIFRVAFSPDGQHIVTASSDRTARIWDTATGELLATLQHDDVVSAAGFSPDGKRIVTASWDRTARVWDSSNGRLLTTLQGHKGELLQAEFSPNGQRVVTASRDHTARLWDSANGRLVATLQHDALVTMAKFSFDGIHVVSASEDNTARVWSTDGSLLVTLRHEGPVQYADFSPEGRYVVTASFDRTARLWNRMNGRLLAVFQVHSGQVMHAAFSPDNGRIVTASADGSAHIWNQASGRRLLTLQGHSDRVYRLTLSPNGSRLVTASADGTARVWSATSGNLVLILRGHANRVYRAVFSPDGRHIATASADGTSRIWDAVDGRLIVLLQGHSGEVWDIAFSPDGQRVITASADQTAHIWSAIDGRLLTILRGHKGPVSSARFSPNGQHIVTSGYDKTARVWNAADGASLFVLQGHSDNLEHAVFSPDGHLIATASDDNTARVWSADDGHLLAVLRGHRSKISDVEFSPDGERLVTSSLDNTARLWSSSDGKLLVVLRGHTSGIRHARFSSDGRRIVTSAEDATARVWDTTAGDLQAILQGHTDTVSEATFAPDGQRIFTASFDHTARVWSIATLSDIEKLLAK